MNRDRTRENAHRLAYALERYAEDQAAVARIAAALNYDPEQLRQDMGAMMAHIEALEAAQTDE